jgi:predicted metal-dependent enzyme (double-stranded beta helix superfamily)
MSNSLHALISNINEAINSVQDINDLTFQIKNNLERYIKTDAFVLNTLEVSLDKCIKDPLDHCIYQDLQYHYRVQLFYWAGNAFNLPHQHNTWSVAGIFHNENIVETFKTIDFLQTGKFIQEKYLSASRGEVGRIIPPCIHKVGNASEQTSLSLHIFKDSEDPLARVDDTFWFDETGARTADPNKRNDFPYNHDEAAQMRTLKISAMIEILSTINNAESTRLLERCFRVPGISINSRVDIVRSMLRSAKQTALLLGEELRTELPDSMLDDFDSTLKLAVTNHV